MKSDQDFFNNNSEHARIVLTALFRHANVDATVYCMNLLSEHVSNAPEYLEAVKGFLERKGLIRVYLTDYNEERAAITPVYQLFKKYPEQVELYRTDSRIIYNGVPVHFTCTDGQAFRLETDITNKKAIGNFNNPQVVQILLKSLKDIDAQQIPIS